MTFSGNTIRAGLAAAVVGATLFFSVGRANAACHHFTVTAAPTSAEEGGKVTVVVKRDAAFRPSHVHVSTVDETARSPADYSKLDRDVNFQSDTSQQFSVTIVDDTTPEGAETFKLHLSKPGGCEVNPNFVLDPDVTVTIKANDRTPAPTMHSAQPTAAPLAAATARASATPLPSASPSATPQTAGSLTPSPSATSGPQATSTKGRPVGRIVGIVLGGAAVASALALIVYRRFVA